MDASDLQDIVSRRFGAMDPARPTGLKPKLALFCDLHLDIKGGQFSLKYESFGQIEIDSSQATKTFEYYLKRFAEGWHPNEGQQPKPGNGNRKSELSIRVEEWVYIAIRLSSKKDNWRYCHEDDPFTVGQGGESILFEPRRVAPDGSIIGKYESALESKAAYFIVDGASIKTAVDSDPSVAGVAIPFNIHLELVDRNGKFIPIIIDPDVGYPDGGTPP